MKSDNSPPSCHLQAGALAWLFITLGQIPQALERCLTVAVQRGILTRFPFDRFRSTPAALMPAKFSPMIQLLQYLLMIFLFFVIIFGY